MPGGLETFGTDFPKFTKGQTDSEKLTRYTDIYL